MSGLNPLPGASKSRRPPIALSASLPLIVICVAAAAGLASARLGYLALAVPLGALLLLTFVSAVSVIATVTLWALLPDSPTFAHISTFSVTPRVAALVVVLIQCALIVARGRVTLKVTFPVVWSMYLAVVLVGGIQNHRLQAVPLFLLFVALPYVAGCTFGTSPQTVRGVIRGIVVGAAVLSAVAIIEFVRNKPFFAPVYDVVSFTRTGGVDAGNLRANAGWIHPLALGMFLCLAAFLVIETARAKSTLLAVGAALLVGGGVFATQERSPLLGLAVGALAYIAAQPQPRARFRAMALALIAVVAIVAVPGPRGATFRQFLGESVGGGNSAVAANINARGQLLQLGVNAVRVRPLFGFGYGSTVNVPDNPLLHSLFSTTQISYSDVANLPVAIAVDTGLTGLAVFLLLVASTFLRLVRERAKTWPLPVPATLAGLIAALVSSLGTQAPTSAAFFMFVLGFGSTACRLSAGSKSDARSGSLQHPAVERRTSTSRPAAESVSRLAYKYRRSGR